jgi:hypothetical protein
VLLRLHRNPQTNQNGISTCARPLLLSRLLASLRSLPIGRESSRQWRLRTCSFTRFTSPRWRSRTIVATITRELHLTHALDVAQALGPDATVPELSTAVLHDVLEDTDWTMDDLAELGVEPTVREAVEGGSAPRRACRLFPILSARVPPSSEAGGFGGHGTISYAHTFRLLVPERVTRGLSTSGRLLASRLCLGPYFGFLGSGVLWPHGKNVRLLAKRTPTARLGRNGSG